MSRIHISIELDSNDSAFNAVLAALGKGVNANAKSVANIEVVGAEEVKAEEVKAEASVKTPTPRASRAKAKPEPTPEPEEEEIEIEEEEEEIETEEEEAAEIDADDIRAVQATKVDKHREAIKAQLKKLGATGIKDLDEAHYAKYYEFLSKLK